MGHGAALALGGLLVALLGGLLDRCAGARPATVTAPIASDVARA